MTRYKSNLFANFAGTGITALLQLAFIPFYIKLIGIEAFGLIGFYIMLQAVMQVLDLGLGATMNREMARYSVQPDKAGETRDFARTLEVGYWALGISAGAIITVFAPLIATRWVNAGTLSLTVVRHAVMLMGGLAALQMPCTIYQAGLMGLQRQVPLNGVIIAAAVFGNGGAVLILWLLSPTVTAFLGWQLVVNAAKTGALGWYLWRSLPPPGRTPRFKPALLRNVWRFAVAMSGITVSALVLRQLDKILLSKLLPLKMFGYYTLATAVGNGLSILVTPVFNATFPRLSAMVAARDDNGVRELYHFGTQIMAMVILPVASIVALFSYDVMAMWTGSVEAAWNTAPVVSVLIAGMAINGLMNLPYALQLAYGWTRIGLQINTFLIISMVPAIIFLTMRYGAVGGAASWALINGAYLAIGIPLTHRRLLPGDARRWVVRDVALPLVTAVFVALVGRRLTPSPMSPFVTSYTLLFMLTLTTGLTAMAAPEVRAWILSKCRAVFIG